MPMIKINGEMLNRDELFLQEYLEENNYQIKKIAVECNGEIVTKLQYSTFVLHSGDVVEIVSLVGGG